MPSGLFAFRDAGADASSKRVTSEEVSEIDHRLQKIALDTEDLKLQRRELERTRKDLTRQRSELTKELTKVRKERIGLESDRQALEKEIRRVEQLKEDQEAFTECHAAVSQIAQQDAAVRATEILAYVEEFYECPL